MSKRWFAFYTKKSLFWVNAKPDFSRIADHSDITDLMGEVVFGASKDTFSLRICRDGLIMVRVELLENDSRWVGRESGIYFVFGEYYDYLNTVLLLFGYVMLKNHNRDIEAAGLSVGDAFRFDDDMMGASLTNETRYPFLARFRSQHNPMLSLDASPLMGPRSVYEITDTDFDELITEFGKVIDDYNKVKILSQVMVSIGSYRLLNFTASLVQAWFVIEYFINVLWFDFLKKHMIGFDDGGQWKNKKARKFFSGLDFTASIMSQFLVFGAGIDHSVFKKIDRIRKKRNEIVHSSKMIERHVEKLRKETNQQDDRSNIVTPEDCQAAFDVICYFVNQEYGIDLRISGSFGYNLRI